MSERYSAAEAASFEYPVLLSMDRSRDLPGVVLNRAVCVVGARCLVHLPLDASTVSKAQALIIRDSDGVYVRDLASKNQTFVDNRPVRETWLDPSNEVRFGPFTFRCESGFERNDEPASVPAAELWLKPDGLASRQVAAVRLRTFLIGTRQGCDLVLQGEDIALAHAVIFSREGRRHLRDLSTIRGTFVNGKRIREVELEAGDEIRIGENRIEYYPIETRAATGNAMEEGTMIGFVESPEDVQMLLDQIPTGPVERAPISDVELVREMVETPVDGIDEIVLPWDIDTPIEMELADSKTG